MTTAEADPTQPRPVLAPIRPVRVEAVVLRAPIPTPVRTSFGVMHDRPALLVRVEEAEGAAGWGEVWCNFPACGAEHRARLVESVLAPRLVGATFDDPAAAFRRLTDETRILAIQAGEPGPLAQAIAGIDVALWDLAARRARVPLWKLLGGRGGPVVPVYASGINPEEPERVVRAGHAAGFRAFKLKVGFGRDLDLRNVRAVRELIGEEAPLMVDANQAWGLPEALEMSAALAELHPTWLEEPIAADSSPDAWAQLAARSAVPLAAGENLRGEEAFGAVIRLGAVRVVQPDLAKWGGFSGCLPVARLALDSGLVYCPHFLGAGIGLLASAHLLAAVGGPGMLEVDVNPNPLQSDLIEPFPVVDDGRIRLPDGPGLGVAPRPEVLAAYRVGVSGASDSASR